MRESNVLRQTWLAVAAIGTTLFRLNTGRAWLSNLGPKGVHRLKDGSIRIEAPRSVALGFGMPNGDPLVGSSDLIGWSVVEVTPDMVGRTVAIFTAIECKESGGGKKGDDQINFVDRVRAAGGIAGFANSPAVAQGLVRDFCVKATADPVV